MNCLQDTGCTRIEAAPLKGVIMMAAKVETAVMLTDTAQLPRAR